MITTSICLPENLSGIWRKRQKEIMRQTLRILRIQLRKNPVRRGRVRHYNRMGVATEIVTTRFGEAEYDALHLVASAIRVSVSWLVYTLIMLWQKPARRYRQNTHVTNYDCHVAIWQQNAGVITESLLFWRKIPKEEFTLRADSKKISS